jgi:3-hydroxybutyryl-CoA dehydratase
MATVTYFEDLSVGMSAEASRVVREADLQAFAEVSGDFNPIHLDADYAAKTQFKERIAHGMLSASYISGLLASKMPGAGAVYLSQTLTFKRPVKIGDEVATRVEIKELDDAKARVTLLTTCSVRGKTVLEGEATLLAPRKPA